MFSKTKRAAILLAASALLATSLGGNIAYADAVTTNNSNETTTTTTSDKNSNTSVATATNDSSDSSNQVVYNALDQTKDNSSSTADNSANTATTQASYSSIDTSAVRAAMLAELNRLRDQNGLSPLIQVGVLNTYAQGRTDSFTNTGVDNHAGWNSANMYPYHLDAEENIAQMPYSMLGSTDPNVIAQKITHEFYSEMYDPEPNYGHRKNMLNPYINYVGIGVSVASNGMVYFSQEMGNDQAAHSKYDASDIYAYYLTNENDYANVSKYDIADTKKTGADYETRDNYATADLRGGVTTKNQLTPVYDRYGKKVTNFGLAPNTQWASDIIAIIDGNFYYHVSTNGFVSANDALPWASFLSGTSVKATTTAKVYSDDGTYTGKTVPAGSVWSVDRRSVNPKTTVKMYRIATNMWIQQNQLSQL